MRQDPIEILPYSAAWPVAFERQRGPVEKALGRPVEHIGSTAVPGLPAKPIIDMVAVVARYEDGSAAATALRGIGWLPAPEPGDAAARKWSFCYPSVELRSHHLHVYEEGDPLVPRLLAFRDHLRTHPADAAEYARIKTELAAADAHDRPRYRSGKAPFIEAILHEI